MNERSRSPYGLAVACTLLFTFLAGCRARELAAPPTLARPAGRSAPGAAQDGPYGAWIRHTDAAAGEDVYPSPVPGGGIVFSSNRHSRFYKLYLREPRGRIVRQLTDGEGDDVQPACDPSGTRVAFTSNRSGGWRLYLLPNLDGAAPTRIGPDDADVIAPAWSPAGDAMAYCRRSPVSDRWEIWILDLASHQQRFVGEGLFPAYDPTGKSLAFQRERQRDGRWYSLWTVRVDGTWEREILAGRDWGAVNPCWSPDGQWIAFNTVSKSPVSRRAGAARGDDLYIVRSDGESLTQLTFRPTPEWNPAWGSDGRIYFSATLDGETAIWSLDPRR